MSSVLPMLKNADIAKYQYAVIDLYFSLSSGTPSKTPASNGCNVLFGVAAASLTSALCDSFLGVTGDVAGDTCFDATSMGTDSFGFVINMAGQAQRAVAVEAFLYDSTVIGVGKVASTTALTSSLSTALACSSAGNLYGRVVMTGLDSSSSLLRIRVSYELK